MEWVSRPSETGLEAAVGIYELRYRRTGERHSAHATKIAALAHVELIVRTDGPDAVRPLSLVQIDGDGNAFVVAEGEDMLSLVLA